LGFGGLILGSLGGWTLAYFVDKYKLVKLPPDVYMLDYVPIKPQLSDWIIIALLTLFISYLAAFVPSYISSRLKPVDALRRVV
jgi:lipoprotein-releasing system permease protein